MNRRLTVGLYLALVLICGSLMAGATRVVDLWALDRRGQTAIGQVRELDCRNHHSVVYSVFINGREQFGKGTVNDCPNRVIGSVVNVTYDPLNTEIKSIGSPSVALQKAIRGVVLVALAVPLILLFALKHTVAKRRGS
jgi:hypothetical protein